MVESCLGNAFRTRVEFELLGVCPPYSHPASAIPAGRGRRAVPGSACGVLLVDEMLVTHLADVNLYLLRRLFALLTFLTASFDPFGHLTFAGADEHLSQLVQVHFLVFPHNFCDAALTKALQWLEPFS